MARVTVEDCVDKVDSPYELVLVAKERAAQLSSGVEPTLDRDNDKNITGYFRANMNFKLGRFEEAIKLAIESLEGSDEKEESELSKIIGESYFNLEEYRSALSYLPDYKGKNGKLNNTHHYQLGYSNYKLKNYNEAILNFNKIVSGKDKVAQKDELQKINRYYISNKGCKIVKINKNDQREIQLESGQWVQTVMNKIENKKWSDYDINEKYYLNAIEKEINNIIGVKNNQLMLFE